MKLFQILLQSKKFPYKGCKKKKKKKEVNLFSKKKKKKKF